MKKQMIRVWIDTLSELDSPPVLSDAHKQEIILTCENKGYRHITFEDIHYEYEHQIYGMREETDFECLLRERRETLHDNRHAVACEQALKSLNLGKTDGS